MPAFFDFFLRDEYGLQHRRTQEAKMSGTRRRFFQDAAIFGAGLLGMSESLQAQDEKATPARARETHHEHTSHGASLPMTTPDVADLPHEMDGAVKVFRLAAKPVKKKIPPL